MKKKAIDLFKKYTKGDLSTVININGYRIRVERKGRKVISDEIHDERLHGGGVDNS